MTEYRCNTKLVGGALLLKLLKMYFFTVMTAMWCWVGWGGLLSGGKEWEGTGPYGDPCCTEQVNTLSLFCSLLVVLTTELAHRVGERERERDRFGS